MKEHFKVTANKFLCQAFSVKISSRYFNGSSNLSSPFIFIS